jgi:hypothetical protein
VPEHLRDRLDVGTFRERQASEGVSEVVEAYIGQIGFLQQWLVSPGLGMPYTIVAPVYFMDNLLTSWTLPQLKEDRLPMTLPSSRPLQQIAVSDIAAFAALVLESREEFEGRRVNIASDGGGNER